MKKVYERPVMMAEEYTTNAYCNSCGTSFKTGNLVLNQNSTFCSTNNDGGKWTAGRHNFKKDGLYHTFSNENIYQTVDGSCGIFGPKCENNSQSIWRCTCCDEPWYLELSHYYTEHVNHGAPTFFLYKEATGDQSFNIIGSADSWPAVEQGHSDYNVAQVVFQEEEGIVDNS